MHVRAGVRLGVLQGAGFRQRASGVKLTILVLIAAAAAAAAAGRLVKLAHDPVVAGGGCR